VSYGTDEENPVFIVGALSDKESDDFFRFDEADQTDNYKVFLQVFFQKPITGVLTNRPTCTIPVMKSLPMSIRGSGVVTSNSLPALLYKSDCLSSMCNMAHN
jgi:hypothetical protein